MINTPKQKVSFRIHADLVDRLQDFAVRERVSVSQVLCHLVIRFFSGSPEPSSFRCLHSPDLVAKKHDDFRDKCCTLFDDFKRQGFDTNESIKRTNFALKAVSHPWASYEVVSTTLRSAGRFRKEVNK
ncbi:MAG TPA: hypothetical protein VFG19_09210 [Geobacteraceae bacterium]|nr:hypothetical protein [Geobacteraceae bacterium]